MGAMKIGIPLYQGALYERDNGGFVVPSHRRRRLLDNSSWRSDKLNSKIELEEVPVLRLSGELNKSLNVSKWCSKLVHVVYYIEIIFFVQISKYECNVRNSEKDDSLTIGTCQYQ